jgi:hypothetical protein
MNSSIKTSGWIAMAAERAWGIRMKNEEERVCKSAEPSRGSEKSSTMEAQLIVNDSKREVFLHVESQHLSDWALPFTI